MQCLPDIPTHPFTSTIRLKKGEHQLVKRHRGIEPRPLQTQNERTNRQTDKHNNEITVGQQDKGKKREQDHRHMADPEGSPVNRLIQHRLVCHKREKKKTKSEIRKRKNAIANTTNGARGTPLTVEKTLPPRRPEPPEENGQVKPDAGPDLRDHHRRPRANVTKTKVVAGEPNKKLTKIKQINKNTGDRTELIRSLHDCMTNQLFPNQNSHLTSSS